MSMFPPLGKKSADAFVLTDCYGHQSATIGDWKSYGGKVDLTFWHPITQIPHKLPAAICLALYDMETRLVTPVLPTIMTGLPKPTPCYKPCVALQQTKA